MTSGNVVDSIGLILDIAGGLIWFVNALPKWVEGRAIDGGVVGVVGEDDSNSAAEARRIRSSRQGVGVLIVGFVFQLISNFLK